MAERTQAVRRLLVDRHEDRDAPWEDVPDGATPVRRIGELPGRGAQQAQILVALPDRQVGVPPGRREATGDRGDDGARRSVADITEPVSLGEVRAVEQQLGPRPRRPGEIS